MKDTKRKIGWVRRLGKYPRWRAVTGPLWFKGEVLTILARLEYWDAEDECSMPGWSTLILDEGEVPGKCR